MVLESIRSEARSRSVDLLDNIDEKLRKYLYGRKNPEIEKSKDGRMVTFNKECELDGSRTRTTRPGNFYTLSQEQQNSITQRWEEAFVYSMVEPWKAYGDIKDYNIRLEMCIYILGKLSEVED